MKDKNQKLVTEKGYKRMIAKTIMSPLIYLVVIVMLATNNQIMEPENHKNAELLNSAGMLGLL